MTDRTIARRYVRALFELALEAHEADGVLVDLERVAAKLDAEPALLGALLDPRSSMEARRAVLGKVISSGVHALTSDFAMMLLDRGRMEVLPVAADEFAAMLRDQRGEALAEVTSTVPLDAETKAALIARLEELTRRKITLEETVDASLLGGLRVKVGSMLLDGSLRRRLAGMKDELLRVTLPRPATAQTSTAPT